MWGRERELIFGVVVLAGSMSLLRSVECCAPTQCSTHSPAAGRFGRTHAPDHVHLRRRAAEVAQPPGDPQSRTCRCASAVTCLYVVWSRLCLPSLESDAYVPLPLDAAKHVNPSNLWRSGFLLLCRLVGFKSKLKTLLTAKLRPHA